LSIAYYEEILGNKCIANRVQRVCKYSCSAGGKERVGEEEKREWGRMGNRRINDYV